jgi:hypothetical protein
MHDKTAKSSHHPSIKMPFTHQVIPLKLHIIIEQPNLLTRLKSRHPNIRTPITTERISQTTVPTRPNLSLDCKIHFREIFCTKFEGLELCVGGGPFGRIFGCDFLGEPAGAIFACSSALTYSRSALGGFGFVSLWRSWWESSKTYELPQVFGDLLL